MPLEDSTLVATCSQVVGPGTFCGRACAAGRVLCSEHMTQAEARTGNQVMEAARQRVLLKLEERAEDLATTLVELARDEEVPATTRLDALNSAFKVLGLDKVQVQVETRDTTPGRAARDSRLLDLLERAGASDRAASVRQALGVVDAVARDA